MNQTGDVAEQKKLMRAYEKRVLNDLASSAITLWWYRIIPHRTYFKGWEVTGRAVTSIVHGEVRYQL